MTDPTPQQKPNLQQRALDAVNESESWFKANRAWLIAIVVALVLGFIVAHAMK